MTKRVANTRQRQRQREVMLKRDGGLCFYCNEPMGEDCTNEHLLDRAYGGCSTLDNQVLAHKACNQDAVGLTPGEKIRRHLAAVSASVVASVHLTANYIALNVPMMRGARTPFHWPPQVRP